MSFLHLEDSYRGNRLKQVLLVFLFETEVNKTERPLWKRLISVGGGFRLFGHCSYSSNLALSVPDSTHVRNFVNARILVSKKGPSTRSIRQVGLVFLFLLRRQWI
jgi:hypothetical protein